MKKEIKNRKDLEAIIHKFYEKVKMDSLLSPYFSAFNHEIWVEHLKIMTDFWESIIFQTNKYNGNPMDAHKRVNMQLPISEGHFKQWLSLFTATIREGYQGEKADLMEEKALSIASIMQENLQQK